MLILYGASGHGKIVHSICSMEVSCFVDDNNSIKEFCKKPVYEYSNVMNINDKIVITIGDNLIRSKVVPKINHNFSTIISTSATVDDSVIIGIGSQVIHSCLIQTDVVIGNHCIINSMSSIDHDCIIHDFVHIAPNATLCGGVYIGEGSLIGAGAVVLPGVRIGKWSTIGAGAIVVNDIPDNCIAYGNPCKIIS